MEITPELLIDIGKQLQVAAMLAERLIIVEEKIVELEIEMKALQKSTHEVQFMPASEASLPEDEFMDEYENDPRAKEIVKKLFTGAEDMEDARE